MARRDDGGRDALFESAPLATSSERPLPFPGFRPVGDLVDVGRFSKMGFVPPFHGDRSLYTEELKRLFNPDPNSPPRASRSQIGHGSQVGQDLLDAASPSKNEYELFGSKRDDFVLSSGLLTESLQDFYRASFRTPPDQRVTMMTSASSRENGDVSPRVAVALQHASVLFPVPPPPLNYPTPTPPAVLSAARGVCDNNAASYPRGGLAGGVPGHGVAEPLSPAALLQDAVEQQRHRLRFCSNGSCSSGSSDAAADDFVLNGTDSDLDLMDLTQMRRRKRQGGLFGSPPPPDSDVSPSPGVKPLTPEELQQFVLERKRLNRKRRVSVCVFCKNNGEREEVFISHTLKDATGKVTCPVLRAYTCPHCGANGDVAHTIKYCPFSSNDLTLLSSSAPSALSGRSVPPLFKSPPPPQSRGTGLGPPSLMGPPPSLLGFP